MVKIFFSLISCFSVFRTIISKNGYLLRELGLMTPSGPLPPLGWAKSPSLWLFFIEAFPKLNINIRDYKGPYRTIWDHTETYVTIRDHKCPYMGPYGSIRNHTGP